MIEKIPFISKTTSGAGDTVCYCFGYTRQDIVDDYAQNGHSTIFDRIAAEKKLGTCRCAANNPNGR